MDPVILARPEHHLSRKHIDYDALKVLYRLNNHGHQACLVGGGVRDILLGKKPKDFDVATDARPGEVRKLFRNSRTIGRRFRLVHVFFRGGKIIEVSTFRKSPEENQDQGEEEQRFLANNTFGTPKEDALRRDFTINALLYDISNFSIIDYTGGLKDLDRGIIRTIGDPFVRFVEDPVRILRALDYTARLSFSIDPETDSAIDQLVPEILRSAPARLTEEILDLFRHGAAERTIRLFYKKRIFAYLLPSLNNALSGEDDPWFTALSKVDEMTRHGTIVLSDALIFTLIFLPSILATNQPLSPGLAMKWSEDLIHNKDILIFPKRLHHLFQQILVVTARLQQPPKTNKLRRLVTRNYFPYALDFMRCISDAYPHLTQHLSHWKGVHRQFLKTGKLSTKKPVHNRRRSK